MTPHLCLIPLWDRDLEPTVAFYGSGLGLFERKQTTLLGRAKR